MIGDVAHGVSRVNKALHLLSALERVHLSFDHRPDASCECPYCTSDIEALVLHAADYEMRCFSLEQKNAELQKQLTAATTTKTIWCLHCLIDIPAVDAFDAIAKAKTHELNCEFNPLRRWVDTLLAERDKIGTIV